MKKLFLLFLFVFIIKPIYSQEPPLYPKPGEGVLDGGLGLNWIDGELYYNVRIMPELSLGNWGMGLDLNFNINKNGNIRKEDFNELSDYLSIIRYIRYGEKHDPVYIKLGALDYYTLGHGTIVDQYNNSPSIDTRKIGLVADIDFGSAGFESIYSTFGEAGLTAARVYVRPLRSALAEVPIISDLEIGASYAVDFNKYSGIISELVMVNNPPPLASYAYLQQVDKGRMQIAGVDIGLPIVHSSIVNLELYSDYSKIINYGSGVATGIMLDLNGLGILNASAKLERRFNKAQYIPSYFNSLYEIQRYQYDTATGTFSSKANLLASMTDPDNGYFGELDLHFLGLLDIIGSYQRLDKTPNSGELHLVANVSPQEMPVVVRGGYDKINIGAESQLFKVDNNSYMYFEFGYKPLPYLLVSMLYNWTWAPIRDANSNIVAYQPQKRIEPKVSFIYPFNLGQ